MPFLEQQRRSPRAETGFVGPGLNALLAAGLRWWAPVWAGLFLAASCLGGWLPPLPLPGVLPPDHAARAACLAPLLLQARRRALQATAWLLVMAGALLWGNLEANSRTGRRHASAPDPVAPAAYRGWTGPLAVRTTGHPAPTAGGRWRQPAVVLARGPGQGDAPPRRGDGALLSGDQEHRPGAVLTLLGEVRVPPPAAIGGGFDQRLFLAGRGLRWTIRARSPATLDSCGFVPRLAGGFFDLREDLRRRLDRLLPPREARLAAAVLLGSRTPASRAEAAGFSALGLAHLFAVSGLHVGVLAGLFLAPARVAGAGATAVALTLSVAVPVFMILTGVPGSVVRAGSVVLMAATAAAAGRRAAAPHLLGLVFWGVVAATPQAALDVGVRLSYLAAAGILAGSALTDGFAPAGGSRPARLAAAGLGVSLAAQWATLPVVASAFGRLSAWSPLANLVAVPVFGGAVWLLAAALVLDFLWPGGAAWLAAAAWVPVRLLAAGAAFASRTAGPATIGLGVPGAAAISAWLGVSALTVVLLRRSRGIPATVGVVLALAAGVAVIGPLTRDLPPRHGPRAIQFAVDQGDCALIAFPDGWLGLVDTAGRWGRRRDAGPLVAGVLPWLERRGVARLDAVVLTHGHRDHTGGADVLSDRVAVGRWLGGGRAGATVSTGNTPWRLSRPDTLVLHRWRRWRLLVLDPGRLAEAPDHENDRSLVLVLMRGDRAEMLWSGDLERAGEAALLAAGLIPAGVTVWKAGHHGSDTSGSPAFLARLEPQHVLISCGVDNSYGHPSHGPYRVAGDTARVWRTDLEGTVTMDWRGENLRIRALNPLSRPFP